jgi:2'-5' RNA ligase
MLPPVIRIFFAIDLPQAVKEKLTDVMKTLKKQSRSYGIRWAKPDNLHITLQFLAEIHTEHLPNLIANVRNHVAAVDKAPMLNLGTIKIFPDLYRPRVIVLDVIAQEELAELSRLIGEGIKATNYEIESRPFRAHLTLGRIKQPHALNLSFLAGYEMPAFEQITVENVALFRSEPHPEGSQYTVLERITLGSAVSLNGTHDF